MEVTAFLGVGANLGRREAQIRAAIDALDRIPGITVEAVSRLRETEPVGGPPDQPPFLNGAVRLRTTLPAITLLHLAKELERRAGRDLDAPRNSPRPLDLDLLLYGEELIDTKELVVPHPRLAERAFVVEPLSELGVDLATLRLPPRLHVVERAAEVSAWSRRWLRGGCVVGLVPTMGALHEGHVSLLRAARAECDRVIASIFVNPLQFGPCEDLDRYPRTLERDLEVLREERIDLAYTPPADAMYPEGYCTHLSVGAEAEDMEGACRPGHFAGVATVVAKLFAAARPTFAYFGQKDAQQVAVVRRMARDLDFDVAIRVCPTVREPDGLALSSRNVYLSPQEREVARALPRALRAAREAFAAGERDRERLRRAALDVLAAEPLVEVQYLEIRREGDLAPLPENEISGGRILVAAKVGETRLIDNMSLDVD